MKAFMAITFHYCNSDFEIISNILDFIPLHGKHTGVKMACKFQESIDNFGIPKDKVFTVTVDNASSNDTMVEALIEDGYLESGEHHVRCFAHILNLVAQNLLELIDDVLRQVRINNKVIFFSHSISISIAVPSD